jgi:nucleotide-binding universal stress UspA family protein
MEIKDVLVFLEAGAPCQARLDLTAALAERFGAAVKAVASCPEPSIDFAYDYVIGPQAVGQALAERSAAITETLAPTEAAFRAYASVGHGEWDWEAMAPSTPARELALKARWFDLAILRRPEQSDHFARALAEIAALASGTACLFVPEPLATEARFERVVLAWNGSREAKRALDEGLVFLKAAASVAVVMVGEDAGGGEGETALLRHLARHDVIAQPHRVGDAHADAGEALLEASAAFRADLLVMGAYGHSKAAELVLGGATRTVLSKAALPVLMAH